MAPDKKTHLTLALNKRNSSNLPSDFSPVTDLSNQMDDLFSSRSSRPFATPKRRFSWSMANGDTAEKKKSTPDDFDKEMNGRSKKFPSVQLADADKSNTGERSKKFPSIDAEKSEEFKFTVSELSNPQRDAAETQSSLPTGFQALIKDPFIAKRDIPASETTEKENLANFSVVHDARKCSRSLFDERAKRIGERNEACGVTNSKRRKAVSFCYSPNDRPAFSRESAGPNHRPQFQRSFSSDVVKAVELSAENPDLIGDFSRSYALPLIKGRHADLKSISPETLSGLLRGEYESVVESHVVVDCRYPYEYEGGHIRGAVNLYSRDDVTTRLLKMDAANSLPERSVLVFHCEFSSERGPALSRFLRNRDREMNEYPSLFYPEVYVLDGGYKGFYERCKELCEPAGYTPMLDKGYAEELRLYRAKSKSSQEDRKRKVTRCGLKL